MPWPGDALPGDLEVVPVRVTGSGGSDSGRRSAGCGTDMRSREGALGPLGAKKLEVYGLAVWGATLQRQRQR